MAETPDIMAEVISSEKNDDGTLVTIRTTKLSPVPSEMMVGERARARAIVEAGITDTVSGVFTGGFDIGRLTSRESFRVIDTNYPKKMEFKIQVHQ